jgi:hypothetical protein
VEVRMPGEFITEVDTDFVPYPSFETNRGVHFRIAVARMESKSIVGI